MKLKYIYLVTFLLALSVSCQKDEIMTFNLEDTGIYFQNGGQTRLFINSESYYDSIDFSFGVTSEHVKDTIIYAKLKTMGKVKEYDRPVKMSIDAAYTTAEEGKHYTVDLGKAVIPAGSSSIEFPITLHRASDLMNNKVQLMLKLEDNEHFKIIFTEQKNTNVHADEGAQIMADRFKILISEIYTQPGYWSTATGYFGTWTVDKYKYINNYFDIPIEDWETNWGRDGSKIQSGKFPVYAYILQNALQEAADAGTPVMDGDQYMQLGNNYQVDYSAYLN